jgi:hypothetical protein
MGICPKFSENNNRFQSEKKNAFKIKHTPSKSQVLQKF